MFTPDEFQLYQRQISDELWSADTQLKLKKAKAFVAGTGGLGSPLLYYLAAAGIGNITICDFDRVEMHNLNRQILHTFDGIGTAKTASAKEALLKLNPYVTITMIDKKISARNAFELVADAEVIIDCLDNFRARQILNMVSVKKMVPLIHGGVAEFRGQISFLQPPETPCLACFIDDDSKSQKLPIVGATAGVIGSLQAVEAIKFFTGSGKNLKNRLLFWDGLTMTFESITLSRNPRCRVCKNL